MFSGKFGEKLMVGVGLLLAVGLAMGSGSLHNISWDKLKESHWKVVTGKTTMDLQREAAFKSKPASSKSENTDKTAAGNRNNERTETATAMSTKTARETVKIVLYYADKDGEYLKAQTMRIPKKEGIARAALEELIKGPRKGDGLQRTIPSGTKLKDINIENGLCTVDFSKELRDNHWGGSTGELLTVYSIVDVLTQFPTVEKVQILIDGQKVDTLAGHMDLSKPFERNTDIIK
ncbi:Lipoprotein LpqB, GerMN domain-containing protein [Thermincola ferriacetica]|uniref:Lipoprotein LpqB, GerMN domain-containing protein n=1 Tax=Thermincola ferriacetica TaxID=281456 RepID=A0A0L6VYJ2_9FIRM|nr:GerMN domain-containing protein [Thermincola ferriacetica]KNZ68325.1 Lipoprotein LpqB, GerMN domain-containing protein [Thermincola ferriacetica]